MRGLYMCLARTLDNLTRFSLDSLRGSASHAGPAMRSPPRGAGSLMDPARFAEPALRNLPARFALRRRGVRCRSLARLSWPGIAARAKTRGVLCALVALLMTTVMIIITISTLSNALTNLLGHASVARPESPLACTTFGIQHNATFCTVRCVDPAAVTRGSFL